jgi:hypothetical protein
VYGVDEDRLTELVRRCQESGEPQTGVVAKGTHPKPGEPAKLEVLVAPPERPQYTEEADADSAEGHTDYHFPAPIISVQQGQQVARKVVAKEGLRGTNVLGKEVPPPVPEDPTPRPTFRIDAKEEGRVVQYYAAEAGEFLVDDSNNTFYVLTEHTINGDVTIATGDVLFVADVNVKGNVVEGAVIRAGGNVQVMGRCDAAFVRAEGDISITQGIVAGGKGLVEAEGNIEAAFAEGAVIRAGGDVTCRKGILNSDVSARGSIFCTQGRGCIMGGTARARKTIEVKKLGSPSSGETYVIVGVDYLLLEKREQLQERLEQCKANIEKFNRALGPVAQGADISTFPPETQQNIRKALEGRVKLEEIQKQLKAEMKSVEADMGSFEGGSIRVMQEAYAGTKVRVRDVTVVLTEQQKYCTITEDRENGEIQFGPLN